MNTSAKSRELAHGTTISSETQDNLHTKRVGVIKKMESINEFLFALTRTYAIIVSRWGGGGRDVIGRSSSIARGSEGREHATDKTDPCIVPFFNVLCFSTPFVKAAWAVIQSDPSIISNLHELVDVKKRYANVLLANVPKTRNSPNAVFSC